MTILSGCGGKQEELPSVKEITPPIDAATAGTIRGTVKFQGEAPKPRQIPIKGNPECFSLHPEPMFTEEIVSTGGKLQNAVVYVKAGLDKYQFPIPAATVTIDQKKCVFIPHVVAIQAGQPLDLVNSDPTLHNVNAHAKNGRGFNVGFPSKGMHRQATLTAPEVAVQIRCDIHPWMIGYIAVFAHPAYAVTGSDGNFELKGLPPGKYEVEVWHEKLGAQTQQVELGPSETKQIEFTYSPS